MKILVTGVNGQLGYDVMRVLKSSGIEAVGTGRAEMDITDKIQTGKFIRESGVDAVIHCAAYTAVDAAEDNKELCYLSNTEATKNIAGVCKELDIKLMYISTDYVFDGTGERPWEPEDKRNPECVYGDSKYQGELAIESMLEKFFIVRISWVFGINGKNFVKTMLKLGAERDKLGVVADQIGAPTYTADLARLLVDMIQTEKYGHYHATNEGFCSWHEFACEIFKQAGLPVEVKPLSSDEYPAKAKRPKNSRLSGKKLEQNGFKRLPPWKDALARFLKELKQEA